ncbi:MAG TPA: hypothetical protein VFS40_05190 [Gemmatimonadales bacterium]|nr:hypothetical protein [Gemmatimonadales bacterium]
MTFYQITLFLHVSAALGMFAALGIEWAAAAPLRRAASAEEARPWLRLLRAPGRLGGPAALLLLATGMYMTRTTWGRQAWIGLALLGLVLLAVLAAGVTGRRLAALARALHSGAPAAGAPLGRLEDPALVVSLRLRTTLALGIVFLMTSKPAAGLALAAMGTALALGLAWSALALGRRPERVELAG